MARTLCIVPTAKDSKLTPKQAAFVAEYLVDLNATQAAIRAGYSAKTAGKIAAQLVVKTCIADAIAAAQAGRSERLEITQDMVLDRWWKLANADARELVEYRRTCCRHCYGVGFGFQLTQAEKVRIQSGPQRAFYETAEEGEEWKTKQAKRKAQELPMQIGDVILETMFGAIVFGGIGWDPRKDPNDECVECFGNGIEKVHVHDTRTLSPAAVRLYAGVKQTKDGIVVNMQSPAEALASVGKHLGMDKIELTGKDGTPLAIAVTHTVVDPIAHD